MTNYVDIGGVEDNVEKKFKTPNDVPDPLEGTGGTDEFRRIEEGMKPRPQVPSSVTAIDFEECAISCTAVLKRPSPRPIFKAFEVNRKEPTMRIRISCLY